MKTVTLNCASCGAPVLIPDGAETFVCPSCQTTLMVDRGEGYVTLKVLEKLSDSLHEMGQATSSAIKENAYVTQVELKRMQLQHLVSLEEMKLNSLQAELRAAKRRAPGNAGITPEMVDLVLQDNDSRMHIRGLKKEIAQLDAGWEESLDYYRQDVKLLNQAVACLLPYSPATEVSNRLTEVKSEQRRAEAALNQVEIRLLKQDLESLKYPPFDQLSLDQMEELLEMIPGDLARLNAGEKTPAKEKLIAELTVTLEKIKVYFPRKKLESLVGPVVSLDYKKPYPKPAELRQPMIDQVKSDLEKVNSIPAGPVRVQFNQQLHAMLEELSGLSTSDKPRNKPKKRKRRWFVTLLLVIVGMGCLLAAVIFGTAVYREVVGSNASSGLVNQIQGIANDENGEGSAYLPGQFESYQARYVEVTASTTFLRESPSTEAAGSYKVVQGDILVDLQEEGLSDSWYKVLTLDGSASGYLVRDWVNPISVTAVPGNQLSPTLGNRFFTEEYSTGSGVWEPGEFDDEFASGSTTISSGKYVIDLTSNDQYIYRYANQTVEGLPQDYVYSLTLTNEGSTDSVYYGLQTNVRGEEDFDALLIAPEGTLVVLAVRNNQFNLLYDSAEPVNTMAAFNWGSPNTLAVHRYVDSGSGAEIFEYALNGQVLVQISRGQSEGLATDMGVMVYLDARDVHARIVVDDFAIDQ